MQNFEIDTFSRDGSCILVLSGELDLAAAPELREVGTVSLGDPNVTAVVVDLQGVTFIDSTAIGALVGLLNTATAADKPLSLRAVPARVQRLLDITGLTGAFKVES